MSRTASKEELRALYPKLHELRAGRLGWAEALGVADETLMALTRLAAQKMDRNRPAEAEEAFLGLTLLDPWVPYFWLGLGDARARQRKHAEAVEAYTRCIQMCAGAEPPPDEVRSASFRRAQIHAQQGRPREALEDFTRVIELDTADVFDGERAYLAVQGLVSAGCLPQEVLHELPRPR